MAFFDEMDDGEGELDRWLFHKVEGEDPEWLCGDGETYIPLSRIKDVHLQRIERWLLGRGATSPEVRKALFDNGWYQVVRDELERRGLLLLRDHVATLARSDG